MALVCGFASAWVQVCCASRLGVGCGSWFHLMAGRVPLCLLSLFLERLLEALPNQCIA